VAKKKTRIVFDLDEHSTKIRYKRATLTVEQIVAVNFTPVEQALAGHRTGVVSEEEVAAAFLREQVIVHSPSFDWKTAELEVLLERVAAAMTDPKLKARTPKELVPELEAVEVKEREKWAELSKQMGQQIKPLASDLQKKLQQAYPPMLTGQAREAMRKHMQSITGSLLDNVNLQKAFTPSVMKVHGDLSEIASSMIPQARLADLGIDLTAFEQLSQNMLGAPGTRPLVTTNWDQWIEQALRAAQEVEAVEIIDIEDAEVEQPQEQISEADLKELIDRLSEIAKALQEQAGSNPIAISIVATVIGGLILYAIQYVLAVKYGITLTPPEQSSP
jgi:hypothetical protein